MEPVGRQDAFHRHSLGLVFLADHAALPAEYIQKGKFIIGQKDLDPAHPAAQLFVQGFQQPIQPAAGVLY